jgi:WD40 repeat protein
MVVQKRPQQPDELQGKRPTRKQRKRFASIRLIIILLLLLLFILVVGLVLIILSVLGVLHVPWTNSLSKIFLTILIPSLGAIIPLLQWLHNISSHKPEQSDLLHSSQIPSAASISLSSDVQITDEASLPPSQPQLLPSSSEKLQPKVIDITLHTQSHIGEQYQQIANKDKAAIEDSSVCKGDYAEMPDNRHFFGREKVLGELKQWIADDHYQLIALLGIGGIGKTTLAAKVIEQVQDKYKYIFWRTLQNAPSLESIIGSCILFLSDQKQFDLPKDVEEQISLLVKCLCKNRSLIILDNFETILQPGIRLDQYQNGYEGYGRLIQRLGEVQHQSCLLITSREKPKEIVSLEGKTSHVRSLQLLGLEQLEAREILHDQGLLGSDEEWVSLVHLYAGNPLALKLVAEPVRELFGGSISRFLKEKEAVVSSIHTLLDQQFKRLSGLEQEIMYWLAIEREAITLNDLRADVVRKVPKRDLLNALESLQRRSMIETGDSACFTLQPAVMEYSIGRLIELACEELDNEIIEVLARYALIKADAKDYVRDSQVHLILEPIVEQLLATLGENGLNAKLNGILATLHEKHSQVPNYVAGNVLNLLIQLRSDLHGYDFSDLVVWQAYLQNAELPSVNFANATFAKSVFTDTFESVETVKFSPSAMQLAGGTMNGEIWLWQAPVGTSLLTFKGNTHTIVSVAFSPDGSLLASGGDDQAVWLWEVGTGRCLNILQGHTASIQTVAFSPDGKILGSGGDDHTIRLWEVSTGHCLNILQRQSSRILSVVFSPDGTLLASCGGDYRVQLWDVNTSNTLGTFQGHANLVRCISFSPDGKVLASCSNDKTIRLWEVSTGNCLNTLKGHSDWVQEIAFSPDGKMLASGSHDKTIRLWDVNTGRCLKVLQGSGIRIYSVSFSFDGTVLASCGDERTVQFWEVSTGHCLNVLKGQTHLVKGVACNPNGDLLASCSDETIVRLWEVSTGRYLKNLQGHADRVRSLAFNPSGDVLASCSDDKTIRLWEISSGGLPLKTLYGHSNWVWAVAFSPDGTLLASGSDDQTVGVWEVSTGRRLKTLEEQNNLVWAVAFSPDGSILASSGSDQIVRLRELKTGRILDVLTGHKGWIRTIAFSPDGSILASGSGDQTIRLWEVSTGRCLKVLQEHTASIWSIAFSPDGSILASGSGDQTIRLWEVSTGHCLTCLQGHNDWIRAVTFNSKSTLLVSGSQDGTIKFWDVQSARLLKTLISDRPYEHMNITHAKGLTVAQKTMLKRLGATEDEERMPG